MDYYAYHWSKLDEISWLIAPNYDLHSLIHTSNPTIPIHNPASPDQHMNSEITKA